ncbi:hypothetical protein LTR78_005174 [Recurvomyces mirabilis]|uniref:DUF7587 domain-containing protein n=1 Tax=Recurvomyces mirabilis TaxID=574656 RepID=A0AAE0WNE4_9PEZI|nr:hypothetical protein LTR78_005174 [Recurvomyces mirabilis]KAK5157724.1 hypothetical protein LTS14_003646 [Recurvomyces mirabilis]
MSANRPRRVKTKPRGPTNRWDHRQRLALHILYTNFNLDSKVRLRVFNELFKDHQRGCNMRNGVTTAILNAQYGERNKKPNWVAIMAGPRTVREQEEKTELIRVLRDIIATTQPNQSPTMSNTRPEAVQSPSPEDEPIVVQRRGRKFTPQRQPVKTWLAGYMHAPTEQALRPESPAPGHSKQPLVVSQARSAVVRHCQEAIVGSSSASRDELPPHTPPSNRVAVSVNVATPATSFSALSISPTKYKRQEITVELPRQHGPTLQVTPEVAAKAKMPLVEVPDALAHPPTSGLLFRYWDENSFGHNSETGFTAGRFMYNNVPPRRAPKCNELDYADIENHLNRNPIPSPFCSASNCLLWILRLALKEHNRGAKQGKITLIDAANLARKGVYYVRPFHRQLRHTHCFTNGAWRYVGTHEFIVWAHIPQQALIQTFTIADLLAACSRMPAMAAALRIETVGRKHKSLKKTILTQLEDEHVPLSAQTTVVIARLCRFLGLTASSPLPHLEHIVSDVLQGWKLSVQPMSSAEWSQLASLWAHKFCGRQTLPSLERQMTLQMCFLQSVKAGLGDFNVMLEPNLINRMHRKSKAVGLESPTRVVLDAMANATTALLDYEKQVDQRYAEAASTRLLPGIEEYFQLGSDVPSPSSRASRMLRVGEEDQIMFDDDAFGL